MFCALAAHLMIAASANTEMVTNTTKTIGWSRLSLSGTGNLQSAVPPAR